MPAPCHHHKHFVGLNSSDLTTAYDCTVIATVSQTVSQGTERASDCPRVTQLPRAEPETEVKRFQSSLLTPAWAVFCVAELGFERRVNQPRGGGCAGRAEYTESPRPRGTLLPAHQMRAHWEQGQRHTGSVTALLGPHSWPAASPRAPKPREQGRGRLPPPSPTRAE